MLRGRSSSPTFGRRGRINDESDSSFDEKISLINGTLPHQQKGKYGGAKVNIIPAAPTSEPATIKILLLMAKPAAQAAMPE